MCSAVLLLSSERVGFENTSKRSINNMQSTGGAQNAYKAMVVWLKWTVIGLLAARVTVYEEEVHGLRPVGHEFPRGKRYLAVSSISRSRPNLSGT
jgi:hypothetical protein